MNWNNYLDLLKEANEIAPYLTTEHSEEEITQFLLMNLAQAFALIARQDPERPEFFPYANPIFNHSAPNPDNTYYLATIDGNNQYRISGRRNDIHMIEFQVGFDWQGFAENMGHSTQITKISEFDVGEDGYFEILLSQERPEGHTDNWMQLEPRSNYVVVRQIGYHLDEADARMAIENLSPLKTTRRAEFNGETIQRIINFVKYNANGALKILKGLADEGIVNKLKKFVYSDIGGVGNQVYQQGLYEIPNDQAMILTFKTPDTCAYWSIQTSDRLWQSTEYVYAQGHLNGYVDRADSDGLTRLVLSHQDPGIANWVDLYGNETGYILIRWAQSSSTPEPEIDLVPFDRVDSVLPEDTQRVSPEQRQADVRQRAVAKQLRGYW